jgi:hypothetical protein
MKILNFNLPMVSLSNYHIIELSNYHIVESSNCHIVERRIVTLQTLS